MKKLFTTILIALSTLTLFANKPLRVSGDSHDTDPMMNDTIDTIQGNNLNNPLPLPIKPNNGRHLVKKQTQEKVNLYLGYKSDGVVCFLWQGNAPAYDISIGVVEEDGQTCTMIAEGAWYSNVFYFNDEEMGMTTDLLLEYGYTYADYPQYFSEEEYNANVTEDFKLKPNTYVVFVEGVDEEFNTVEETSYLIFTIDGVTTNINNTNTNKFSNKYIKDGKIYIRSGNKTYNILGSEVN